MSFEIELDFIGLLSDKRHKRRIDSSKMMEKARGDPCVIRNACSVAFLTASGT